VYAAKGPTLFGPNAIIAVFYPSALFHTTQNKTEQRRDGRLMETHMCPLATHLRRSHRH